MGYYSPQEVTEITIEKGTQKANSSTLTLVLLGFLGGAFISLGYLLYIRAVGTMPHEWGALQRSLAPVFFRLASFVFC